MGTIWSFVLVSIFSRMKVKLGAAGIKRNHLKIHRHQLANVNVWDDTPFR